MDAGLIPSSSRLKIFLIEDSAMDTNLIKLALSRRNHDNDLTAFKDGESAMLHLRQHAQGEGTPHLAILDLQLAGMDGVDFLAKCKRDPQLKSIPIVVFTSTSMRDAIEQCYNLGADRVVTKPMEMDPFIGAVQDIEDSLRKRMDHGETR
jgi:CheY-like chemotaxis protein